MESVDGTIFSTHNVRIKDWMILRAKPVLTTLMVVAPINEKQRHDDMRDSKEMDLIPLALDDFKVFFTLFPKCFSSFVHTTCSLSVLEPRI